MPSKLKHLLKAHHCSQKEKWTVDEQDTNSGEEICSPHVSAHIKRMCSFMGMFHKHLH